MNVLKEILLKTDEEDYKITTRFVVANTFTGVERKLKGQNIITIIKIDEGEYIALVEE
tara:strand:- start:238 stop:411 length:174 start_codon:yes stop_codon:yes gene_type:complete